MGQHRGKGEAFGAGSPQNPETDKPGALSSAVQQGALERIQVEMAELQERVSAYARQEELERHRVAELDRHAAQTQAAITTERRFKQERGGVDAAKIHFQLMSKNVAIYEKKVRAARVRRSELEKANRSTKEEIGLLRRELQRMLAHYLTLKRRFEGAQAEMAARLERSRAMREETTAAEEELRRLAAAVESQRAADAAVKQELDEKLKLERSSDDKASRVRREKEMKKRVATVVGDMTQAQEEQIKERVLEMERQRKLRERAIAEWSQKAEAYKRELEELKTQTGVHDVDELLEDFAKNEREVFRLYEYVQRADAETKETEEEVEALRREMAEYRAGAEADASRSVGRVRALEEQAAEIQRQSAEYARRAEAEAATLREVCLAVHSIHATVGCERFAGALRGVMQAQREQSVDAAAPGEGEEKEEEAHADGDHGPLAPDAVTDGTVLQVLGVVEQAAYDLVHRFATEVAGKSHEEALPVPPLPPKGSAKDGTPHSVSAPFASPAMPASLFRAKRRRGGARAVRKALTSNLHRTSPASPPKRSATTAGTVGSVPATPVPPADTGGDSDAESARQSPTPINRSHGALSPSAGGASSEMGGFALPGTGDDQSESSGSSAFGDGRDAAAVPAKPLSREDFLLQVAREYGPISLPTTM